MHERGSCNQAGILTHLRVLLGVGHGAIQVVRINELQDLIHDAATAWGHAVNDVTIALQAADHNFRPSANA